MNYKTKIRTYIESDSQSQNDLEEISDIANDLVAQNDVLTSQLGLESKILTTNIIWLQILLSTINIGVHLFMIKTIYDILKKESERLVKVEKLYTIGQLAARLVHDMINPLAVIKMTMAMLLTGSDKIDGDIKEKYKLIERSTNRMIHQVNYVMDFVRTRELQLQQNSLKDIVHSASLTTKIPQNVSLNLPQNDVRLRCDKKQLEVMISNLLSNSVEAIDQNQGIITIKLYEEPKNAFIEVEDSGPGIPDNVMPKIFEPLFSTKAAGTGLGLLSCINIVNAHNGTIKVKNNPTRFIISIPKS